LALPANEVIKTELLIKLGVVISTPDAGMSSKLGVLTGNIGFAALLGYLHLGNHHINN
jgi:hypothetical protein